MKQYKLGITLSGGGAKGFAHLGVLQALAENDIHPDIVSGTSAGAIIGAFYCAGYTPEDTFQIIMKNNFLTYFRPSIGGIGLLNMDKLETPYCKYFPHNKIEELSTPLIITASDLLSGESIIFTKGKLTTALIASSSIPMLFNAVKYKNNLLVDGGLLDNLPVEQIKNLCAKTIGVNANYVTAIKKIDSPIAAVERYFGIVANNTVLPRKKLCDIFIEPKLLGKYTIFDINKAKEIYRIGYEDTIKNIKEIKKNLK